MITISRSLLLALLLLASPGHAADRKDPRLRDEDISQAKIAVEVFTRPDGLTEYVYRLENPPASKGTVLTLLIDLKCGQSFEPVVLPFPENAQGYDFDPRNAVAHTPAAVLADYGSAFSYGVAVSGEAIWGVDLQPGNFANGLRMISPAEPGSRAYKLVPFMDNDESWNYSTEPDAKIPWIDDFTVTGTIAAPGCPGAAPPPSQ